jgi:predicted esterase
MMASFPRRSLGGLLGASFTTAAALLLGCSSSSPAATPHDGGLADSGARVTLDGGGDTNSPGDTGAAPALDSSPDASAGDGGDGGPAPSASCTIVYGLGAPIVDSSGNHWTLAQIADGSLAVQENGALAGSTDKMVALAYVGGILYAESVLDKWTSWTSGAWGTASDPTTACTSGTPTPSSSRLTAKPLAMGGAPNGYYEYLPPLYDGTRPTPLLVFWHGVGEDGNGTTDLDLVLVHGPGLTIKNDSWSPTRPFVVLMPQHSGGGCPAHAEIDAFLQWALTKYDVDAKNVYLTGLSCGAIGSWDYLGTYTNALIAAAVLLSGDGTGAWQAQGCKLANLAIWDFHGTADPTVAYAPDQTVMQGLLACPLPRQDIEFTPIVDGGHDIWEPIYDLSGGNGDIYTWLLANHKP